MAAGVCFGADHAKFLDALTPTDVERRALGSVLPEVNGLFEIDEATASRALERLWHDHADEIVRAIVDDPKEAEKLVREAKASPGRVSDLLRRAARATHEKALLGALPRYSSLGPEATFVDLVARSFRGQGARAAEKTLLQALPREGKERGLAYGLLSAMDLARPHDWQFTETERQFGSSLADRAKLVLTGAAADYHESLGGLLGAAGVADWGRRDEEN